jgi:hypothetical protein
MASATSASASIQGFEVLRPFLGRGAAPPACRPPSRLDRLPRLFRRGGGGPTHRLPLVRRIDRGELLAGGGQFAVDHQRALAPPLPANLRERPLKRLAVGLAAEVSVRLIVERGGLDDRPWGIIL